MGRRTSLATPMVAPMTEPDLSPAHKRAIEGALRWAWAQLVAANDQVLHQGAEEAITAAIEVQLGRMKDGRRLAPGLRDFGHIPRGAKVRAVGGSLEKQPDLTFRPPPSRYRRVTNLANWACFVECKLIEDGHSTRTVKSYSDHGVRRFAVGEYAACMPSGMMLAYVRGQQQLEPSLTPLLPLHGASSIARGPDVDARITVHPRATLPMPCVDVSLVHLWLPVPSTLASPAASRNSVQRRRIRRKQP